MVKIRLSRGGAKKKPFYHLDMSRLRDFGSDIKDINMIGVFGTFLPISN